MNLAALLASLRLYSVQAAALLATFNSIWMVVPDSIKDSLPGWAMVIVNFLLFLYGWIGRQLPQPVAMAKLTAARRA